MKVTEKNFIGRRKLLLTLLPPLPPQFASFIAFVADWMYVLCMHPRIRNVRGSRGDPNGGATATRASRGATMTAKKTAAAGSAHARHGSPFCETDQGKNAVYRKFMMIATARLKPLHNSKQLSSRPLLLSSFSSASLPFNSAVFVYTPS